MDLVQTLFSLEILRALQKGRRTRDWFKAVRPDEQRRKEATEYLVTHDYIEEHKNKRIPFQLTQKGATFIQDHIQSWTDVWEAKKIADKFE